MLSSPVQMTSLIMLLTLLMVGLSFAVDNSVSVDKKIINGYRGSNVYRFTVRLSGFGRAKDDYCTGTLLTRSHVLTTANCLYGLAGVKVTAGAIELSYGNEKNSWQVSSQVCFNWTVHPQWKPDLYQHDLAIIELPRPFRRTKQITTIELDDSDTPLNYSERLRVTGWGLTSTSGDFPTELRWDWVDLLDQEECLGLLEDNEDTPGENYLCKDPTRNPSVYICLYDAGGPLFSDRLVGLTTYMNHMHGGPQTCNRAIAVFTHLRPYLSWIRSVISGAQPTLQPQT